MGVRLARRGIQLKVLETDRTPERQEALYAQGRSVAGKVVTHARAYESAHNWGLAVDVAPLPDTPANWKTLRQEASELGFGLIGEWDPGHLQHPQWPKLLAFIRPYLPPR